MIKNNIHLFRLSRNIFQPDLNSAERGRLYVRHSRTRARAACSLSRPSTRMPELSLISCIRVLYTEASSVPLPIEACMVTENILCYMIKLI